MTTTTWREYRSKPSYDGVTIHTTLALHGEAPQLLEAEDTRIVWMQSTAFTPTYRTHPDVELLYRECMLKRMHSILRAISGEIT